MAFGSAKKIKIKTKRISSSSIINENKKNSLVEHFVFVKSLKNKISSYIFNNRSDILSIQKKNELISHYKIFNCSKLYSWEIQKIFQQSIDFIFKKYVPEGYALFNKNLSEMTKKEKSIMTTILY